MTPDRTMVLTVAAELLALAAIMWSAGRLLDRRRVRRAWLRERNGRQR